MNKYILVIDRGGTFEEMFYIYAYDTDTAKKEGIKFHKTSPCYDPDYEGTYLYTCFPDTLVESFTAEKRIYKP